MRSRLLRRVGTGALLIALLCGAAFTAPGGTPLGAAVAAATPADDNWRGSRIDSDFDGDGFADLAITAEDMRESNDDPITVPGTVTILYGSRNGLTRKRTQTWTSATFTAEPPIEEFGGALAPGDFNGDGFSDLAIGISSWMSGLPGRVRIVYGSRAGLTRAGSQEWSQDSPGIAGIDELGDAFGSTLVAGDFGRGPQDDLVVGVSGEDAAAGAIQVIYGTSSGLSASGNQLFTQATPGIPGKRAALESFGDTLAAADVGRSRHADLVVGVWGDVIAGQEEAGSVNVLYGSAAGLTTGGAQLWSQRSRGISGRPAAGDRFGFSLATGDFDGDGVADAAIAAPSDNDYGQVHVLYGSKRRGLSASGAQTLNRRTHGLASRRNLGYFFGANLAAGNFGGDGRGGPYTDLAIRSDQRMRENEASQAVVLVISGGRSGLKPKASRAWTLDSAGVKGKTSDGGTDIGASMAVGDFGKNRGGRRLDDLALGEGISSGHDNPGVNVLYGSAKELTARGDQRWNGPAVGQPTLQEFGRVLAAR